MPRKHQSLHLFSSPITSLPKQSKEGSEGKILKYGRYLEKDTILWHDQKDFVLLGSG